MTTNNKTKGFAGALFLLLAILLTTSPARAADQTLYLDSAETCLGQLENESRVLVLTIITADYDGQKSFNWTVDVPPTVPYYGDQQLLSINKLENAQSFLFNITSNNANGLQTNSISTNDQFGIPLAWYSYFPSPPRNPTYHEIVTEGLNDLQIDLPADAPFYFAGEEALAFTGTACSTELALQLNGLPPTDTGNNTTQPPVDEPVEVPEMGPVQAVLIAVTAVLIAVFVRRG